MSCLSTEDVAKAWRYAVDIDFNSFSDEAKVLQTSTLTYDTNKRFVPFTSTLSQSIVHAVSSDDKCFALGVGADIDLYDLDTGDKTMTLVGHTGPVDYIAFAPGHPHTLISTSEYDRTGGRDDRNELVVWNVSQKPVNTALPTKEEVGVITVDILKALDLKLSRTDPPLSLSEEDTKKIQDTLNNILNRTVQGASLPSTAVRLSGRLCSSFQSPVFNNAGTVLIFLPGNRPRSNGSAQWDINLYNVATATETTLSGHRDAIMWIGFSADDAMVVSACWDGTFRVWRAESGEQLYVWTTGKQNWTGVFSPDGRHFLGGDGVGVIRVWDLTTGELSWSYPKDLESYGRWKRHVDWSSDGRFIVVGGENCGEIDLFDCQTPISDGQRHPVQCRKLSLEKTKLDDQLKSMAQDMLPVSSLKFIFGSGADIWLASRIYTDFGIEFVSFAKGERWRLIPFERTEDDSADWERLPKGKDGNSIYPEWFALERSKRIAIVSHDGIRFWDLE